MSKTVEAWHFLRSDRRLQYPPRTRVEPGMTLTATERPLKLCSYGLHASRRALDALYYAPGPIVCRVRLSGDILEGDDKLCATERTVLWMADASTDLRLFAAWCARQALKRASQAGRNPDPRSIQAVEAAEAYARGEIAWNELAAAEEAACAAAAEAACAAAKAASWAAAEEAACAAAAEAAWAASWAASWAAAKAAAWAEQNDELERRLWALGGAS